MSDIVIKSLYKLTVQHLQILFCSKPWVFIKFWLVLGKKYCASANCFWEVSFLSSCVFKEEYKHLKGISLCALVMEI